jgi:hypothetical protein
MVIGTMTTRFFTGRSYRDLLAVREDGMIWVSTMFRTKSSVRTKDWIKSPKTQLYITKVSEELGADPGTLIVHDASPFDGQIGYWIHDKLLIDAACRINENLKYVLNSTQDGIQKVEALALALTGPDFTKAAQAPKHGVLYSVTTDFLPFINCGYWTGTYRKLLGRYRAVYGDTVQIETFQTTSSRKSEAAAFLDMSDIRMCYELFEKDIERVRRTLDKYAADPAASV